MSDTPTRERVAEAHGVTVCDIWLTGIGQHERGRYSCVILPTGTVYTGATKLEAMEAAVVGAKAREVTP